MTGVRPMPPPTSTVKPISPRSFLTQLQADVVPGDGGAVFGAPVTAILNLRGRKANSGCSVLHWRITSQ